MRKCLLAVSIVLTAAALFAGAARGGVDVHAGGKTYTPAPAVQKVTAPDGFVPSVALPTGKPYYVTQPPHGTFVEVYSSRLNHVVWVPADEAVAAGWYDVHDGGLSGGARFAIAASGLIVVGLILLTLSRRRRRRPSSRA